MREAIRSELTSLWLMLELADLHFWFDWDEYLVSKNLVTSILCSVYTEQARVLELVEQEWLVLVEQAFLTAFTNERVEW